VKKYIKENSLEPDWYSSFSPEAIDGTVRNKVINNSKKKKYIAKTSKNLMKKAKFKDRPENSIGINESNLEEKKIMTSLTKSYLIKIINEEKQKIEEKWGPFRRKPWGKSGNEYIDNLEDSEYNLYGQEFVDTANKQLQLIYNTLNKALLAGKNSDLETGESYGYKQGGEQEQKLIQAIKLIRQAKSIINSIDATEE